MCILAGRFGRGEIDLGLLMRLGRLPDDIEILLQSRIDLAGASKLLFIGHHPIDGQLCSLRDLPFRPCDIEINRLHVSAGGGALRPELHERLQIPAQAGTITRHEIRSDCAASNEIEAPGDLGVRQNAGHKKLRRRHSAPVPRRAQRRIDEDREDCGLIGSESSVRRELHRRKERMLDLIRRDLEFA